MILWLSLLSVVAGSYIFLKLFRLQQKSDSLKYLGLAIASFFFVFIQLIGFSLSFLSDTPIIPYLNLAIEWAQVFGLAFILSSLAVFIRQSKPVFAQFPMLYTALPLLIVFSYFLVKDTYALKNWLLAIYQGGAIIVGLLMYAVYSYRNDKYRIILSGISIVFISYILFWYVPGIEQDYLWISKILLICGLIVTVIGYEQSELLIKSEPHSGT